MLDRPRGEFSESLWCVLQYMTQKTLHVIRGQWMIGVGGWYRFWAVQETILCLCYWLSVSPWTNHLPGDCYIPHILHLQYNHFFFLSYLFAILDPWGEEWVLWCDCTLLEGMGTLIWTWDHSKYKKWKFCIFLGTQKNPKQTTAPHKKMKKCNQQEESLIHHSLLKDLPHFNLFWQSLLCHGLPVGPYEEHESATVTSKQRHSIDWKGEMRGWN